MESKHRFVKSVLGVSLNASAYWNIDKFNQACLRMNKIDENWQILIGDYLDRHNYKFKKRNKLNVCNPAALALRFKAEILEKSPAREQMHLDWKEALERAESGNSAKIITHLYHTDTLFQKNVNHDIDGFVLRNHYCGEIADDCRAVSLNYVLEEIVVFRQLCSEGMSKFAYLGDLPASVRYLAEESKKDEFLSQANFINIEK